MGIGFSRELEVLRSERERRDRNTDAQHDRAHQHQLDQKHTKHRANLDRRRDRDKLKNTKELLGDPLVRPFIETVAEFLNEHTKLVKATRKQREKRFKGNRGNINPPLPGDRHSPRMPPHQDSGRGPHNGGTYSDISPSRSPGRRASPRGTRPGYTDPRDGGGYDDYGDYAGEELPPRTYQPRPSYRTHPPHNHFHDRTPPHSHPRPRYPDAGPRYTMHGGLGSGDEAYPPMEQRPRGPRRGHGGYPHGRDLGGRALGGRARGARLERRGGNDSGFDEEGPGERPGSGMGGGSEMGSGNTYGGRRGMLPRMGMGRRGESE